MRAKQFTTEANIGTNPKRPARAGSRPDRGHEPTKRYVTDRKTGKQYDPDEEFDKLKNSPEFKAQMKRMAAKEGFDYTMKDLGNDYAGFASNHSMKHKMLKRIKPEKQQLYKDKMNNMHEFDQLFQLFTVAKQRGDIIEQGVAEGKEDKIAQLKKDYATAVHWSKNETSPQKREAARQKAEKIKRHLETQYKQGVAEGEVVQFPKKHKGALDSFDDCPKCGGDLQGGKYMGHAVKVCIPCKQVYLPPNSGIDQKGNKITDEDTFAGSIANGLGKGVVAGTAGAQLNKKQNDADLAFAEKITDPTDKANYLKTVRYIASERNLQVGAMDPFLEKRFKKYKDSLAAKYNILDEIAGAFPSPSTRAKWAADAAASNTAEAKRQADIKAKADAERLRVNNAIVDKEQRINYHPMPDNEVPVKEVDNALARIPGRPGEVDLEQRKNYHLIPKMEQMAEEIERIQAELAEHGKASRELCKSSKTDDALGASMLSSCKSQGLRARKGDKSHKLGKSPESRVKVDGHRIKGKKYGGPLPDWS